MSTKFGISGISGSGESKNADKTCQWGAPVVPDVGLIGKEPGKENGKSFVKPTSRARS
jgi:hypothetical protein